MDSIFNHDRESSLAPDRLDVCQVCEAQDSNQTELKVKYNLCVVLLHNMLLIMSNVVRGYQIISDRNYSSKKIKVLGKGNFTFDRSSQM